MIAKLKTYPSMKDSGIEWLGEVPEHWEVGRLGVLGAFSASGIDKNTVEGEPLIKMINYLDIYKNPTHQLTNQRDYMIVSCPEWKAKAHSAEPGDMFFTPSSETPEEIGMSAVCTDDLPGIVYSYHVTRFRPALPLKLGFQKYWCNNQPVRNQFSMRCKGTTRQILTRGDFRSIVVPLPPFPEQAAIARYLDHVDRRVRQLVRAKRKLIALLMEQKQAIINRAVTRGLDPEVPLKDSGVEWLGKVPEHWEVLRTKYVFEEVDQRSTNDQKTHLSMSQRLGLVPSDMVQSALTSESYVGGKLCEAEDLVLNRLKAHLGVFALAKQAGVISPDYTVFRKKRPMNTMYFELVLRSSACRRELRIRAKGIVEGFWRLYTDDFYDIRVPVPPVPEQDKIIAELDKATAAINVTIVRANRQTELLNEYRRCLIADVVTGKIDVREVATALPDVDPLATDDPDEIFDSNVEADFDELDDIPEEDKA